MVLAVIGTMKAGKSTTINAIVGMEILPNRETAMTTLPTLIRNKHGQTTPVLNIQKIKPLLELSQDVAKKLKQLNDKQKNAIDLNGIDDGKSLIEQLITENGYAFKTQYRGQAAIFEFLRHLNDIMRLAKDEQIAIEPPYSQYENVEDLPVIEVEFCHLKDHQDIAQGSLAILDTPGPNEFGQSAALRNVFKTQLEKASAILLVTDFTQMKTEADQGVRDQLAEIEKYLSKDRLAVIVNKFDQANRNSMSSDDLKNYVANSLMDEKVDISQVFPVSSQLAYLANRAKSHLEHHEKLPDCEQEPWVADFAETALGRRWESKIDDIEEVKASIEELWKDSFFAEPIEKVIKKAHSKAAYLSLESAISKLTEYNNELSNMLNLRSNTMTKDIREIEKMRKNLQKDIDNCLEVSQKVKVTAKSATSELSKKLEAVMDAQSGQINGVLDAFFKEGKAMEKSKQDEMLQKELEKQAKKQSTLGAWGAVFSWFGGLESTRTERLFDPNSPKITFSGSSEAKDLIRKINSSIEDIFENADTELDSITKKLIESTSQDISKLIDDTVKDVLESAKKKLQDNGVELNFKLPAINLTIADVDTAELFDAYQEKTNTETRRRRSSGAWGTVCG